MSNNHMIGRLLSFGLQGLWLPLLCRHARSGNISKGFLIHPWQLCVYLLSPVNLDPLLIVSNLFWFRFSCCCEALSEIHNSFESPQHRLSSCARPIYVISHTYQTSRPGGSSCHIGGRPAHPFANPLFKIHTVQPTQSTQSIESYPTDDSVSRITVIFTTFSAVLAVLVPPAESLFSRLCGSIEPVAKNLVHHPPDAEYRC